MEMKESLFARLREGVAPGCSFLIKYHEWVGNNQNSKLEGLTGKVKKGLKAKIRLNNLRLQF